MANKIGIKHTQHKFILSDIGDVIGIEGQNGKTTIFAAGGVDNAITAAAGGGQANAVQLNYRTSRVTTVATGNDSVKLPKALAGMSMIVINAAAANSMNVYPSSGESINALAADTAIAVAANKHIFFTCAVNGVWNSNLTA